MAMMRPVHYSILKGTVPGPGCDPLGRHTFVCFPLVLRKEPPDKALHAKRVGYLTICFRRRHFILKAEPAHVVSRQSARHANISPSMFPMT